MTAQGTSPPSTSTPFNITVRTEKQANTRIMMSASPSISTPPTSLNDEHCVRSDITKAEHTGDKSKGSSAPTASEHAPSTLNSLPEVPASEGRRSARSSRKSLTTYNVQIVAGTAIHTPTKYLEKHHKNVLHGSLEAAAAAAQAAPTPATKRALKSTAGSADFDDPVEEQLAAEVAQAARRLTSSRATNLRKETLRNNPGVGQVVASALIDSETLVQNSLQKSAALGDGTTSKTEDAEERKFLKPKSKLWLRQGLYVGQHRDFDPRLSGSQNRARKRAKRRQDADVLPQPMFAADRILNEDPHHIFKDFKLPFDTYHPLPRKVKVDGWTKLNKNRFIGDAAALWKRDKQESSQCYCDPEDACGEVCHNRIMLYECDDTNCRLGADACGNRPFAELKRRAKGNHYDYGVEVTENPNCGCGFGVRAMRMFEPHQIIVECAGEIITQSECEQRMKQVYKKDRCYYLMSFGNKMIIDTTRGTIARFVNHSCEPNCEMIKWTVGGKPRMALFAGSRGIMTSDELTYDYNFDPFSRKDIQICRCGTDFCRGVLGPKLNKSSKDRSLTSSVVAGPKRKLQDVMGSARAKPKDKRLPKKSKIYTANLATATPKTTRVQSETARAEQDVTEHSRQTASGQTRASKRSTPASNSRRTRSKRLRNDLPTIQSTRTTTVSFKRKVPMSNASKAVKQPSHRRSVLPVPTKATLSGNRKLRLRARSTGPTRSSSEQQSG